MNLTERESALIASTVQHTIERVLLMIEKQARDMAGVTPPEMSGPEALTAFAEAMRLTTAATVTGGRKEQ